MFAKINSFGLLGLNAFSVDAEIEASGVISEMQIVGLADIAVKESKERMTSAFRTSKLPFPNNRIIINLAPADTKKSGSLHDLAIATAIMAVMGLVDPKELENSAFVGEVSLSGDIRSIDGVLPMALAAYKKGIKQFYCPYENAAEASVIEGLEVIPVKSLTELSLHFCKKEIISPAKRYMPSASQKLYMGLDFADVMGQNAAKKALEIKPIAASPLIFWLSPRRRRKYAATITIGITINIDKSGSIKSIPRAIANTPNVTWLNPSPIIEYLFNTNTTPKTEAVKARRHPTSKGKISLSKLLIINSGINLILLFLKFFWSTTEYIFFTDLNNLL